jgi:REP element-mobilizing transposase RayT
VIFQSYDNPLYFVTFCTMHRRQILANDQLHSAFCSYARTGMDMEQHNVAVGRYVIMPDHVHLFVCGSQEFDLGLWIRGLKRVLRAVLTKQGNDDPWQPGFFDHILRSDESYAEKWEYVRNNPLRAGLVASEDEWPYRGEIVPIDRV